MDFRRQIVTSEDGPRVVMTHPVRKEVVDVSMETSTTANNNIM